MNQTTYSLMHFDCAGMIRNVLVGGMYMAGEVAKAMLKKCSQTASTETVIDNENNVCTSSDIVLQAYAPNIASLDLGNNFEVTNNTMLALQQITGFSLYGQCSSPCDHVPGQSLCPLVAFDIGEIIIMLI